MSIFDYKYRNVPEYYNTMYLDGFTPAEIRYALRKQKLTSARKDARIWKERYEKLLEQTKDFLAAVKRVPEKVRVFLDRILHMDRTESRPAKQRETTLTK